MVTNKTIIPSTQEYCIYINKLVENENYNWQSNEKFNSSKWKLEHGIYIWKITSSNLEKVIFHCFNLDLKKILYLGLFYEEVEGSPYYVLNCLPYIAFTSHHS